jgi:glutamyl-Q tRNA(Asp) synthetase
VSRTAEVRPVLRFAPSPNGRLHLGHAFSALFSARAAATLGGTLVLRIENIDPTRSKPEFEAGIYEDLAWLGLTWPQPVLRQSTRMTAYAAAAEALITRGLIYPCFCSRSRVETAARMSDPAGSPLYPGTCRNLSAEKVLQREKQGEVPQWRLNMRLALEVAGLVSITEAPATGVDALWGEANSRLARPEPWGDTVLVRKEVATSYHLSVNVDDAAQGITHVTRGLDLYAATDLHVLLQRLLGLPAPLYCHHRLIPDDFGAKLAKSRGSLSLENPRKSGRLASELRKQLGFA